MTKPIDMDLMHKDVIGKWAFFDNDGMTIYDKEDVVPVIRCRDCVLYDIDHRTCMYHSLILDRDDDFIFKTYSDDYCSYAERREE